MADRKVVFIEPKSPGAHIFSRLAIPRLGLLILAALLKRAGYEVTVYIEDMFGEVSDLKKAVEGAMLVGISSITSTAPRAYLLADQIRAMGIPVVMGGVHPTFIVEEALQHADYVVRGEGEEAILPLMEAIAEGGDLTKVPSLSYHQDVKIIHNPQAQLITDLDTVPSPDYSLIAGWREGVRMPVISIDTSRGCPYNCAFCSVVPMFGRRYRFVSLQRAVDKIEAAAKVAKHVFIVDDNFTANIERTKAILREVIRRGLKLEWSAQVRAEAARDRELLQLMSEAGCFIVFIGFESINPLTLKVYNKKQTLDDIKNAIEAFHRYGIKIHGMFVLGSDEDGVATIRATACFAKKTGIDTVQFLILTPLPGTKVYQGLKEEGRIIDPDWSRYDAHHTVFQPELMTAYELQIETFRAMKDFYNWPSIARQLLRAISKWSWSDFWIFHLKLYGRRQIRQAFGSKRLYINYLRERVSSRIGEFKATLAKKRIKTVGIPEDAVVNWDPLHWQFLRVFLAKLGAKVVYLRDSQAPKKQPDITLLPYWRTGKEVTTQSVSGENKFELDFSPANFRERCLSLGLLFKGRISEVGRIFEGTLKGNPLN